MRAPDAILPLWPEGVPAALANMGEELGDGNCVWNVSLPTISWYKAQAPNGCAVIICPGGGYRQLSMDGEGAQYAAWLTNLGVHSFVLKSRIAPCEHPAPLLDVLRAMRLVRWFAPGFGIDPERIGIAGSSAGGHLGACAGTLFEHLAGKTGHQLDAVSARPDFMMLLYPVITIEGPACHMGSRQALLGQAPGADHLALMSLERQVSPATPPTLLIHTQEDQAVPAENSILFYQALCRAGVPAALHIFEKGPHGVGMREGLGPMSGWPALAEAWLRDRELLAVP
ncbi:alpha/beta hydrolase [Massilia endophytica]|uniref:alpha/beta hydrolase n=1 Tax=Massilia endophytica TaxID=2899220 RepID=UPI001E40ED1A|nr:alpha/beta hydrolase [Massilia endophytica]UGQ49117.1 alpha/beta hydrolase [Massilia endophytica]